MKRLFHLLVRFVIDRRPPDVVIGGAEDPYLRRWWLLPRNRFLNIYLHHFMRSDDDRALHCHPWANLSILLQGEYTEHLIAQGGVHEQRVVKAGEWRLRASGKLAHRIELHAGYCWTIFVTGPKYREWGFHCSQGWRHWRDFTSMDGNQVGRGCE